MPQFTLTRQKISLSAAIGAGVILTLVGCTPPPSSSSADEAQNDSPVSKAAACSEKFLNQNLGQKFADSLPTAVSVPALPKPICLGVSTSVGNGVSTYLATSFGTWENYSGLFEIDGPAAVAALTAAGYTPAENDPSYLTAPTTAWQPFLSGAAEGDSVPVGAVQAHTSGEAVLETFVEYLGVKPGTYTEIQFQIKTK
ncbi:hypothetical protein BH09ACT3_BH09ACT3_01100 [soil metagenome]